MATVSGAAMVAPNIRILREVSTPVAAEAH
jgi:hypothetical protein